MNKYLQMQADLMQAVKQKDSLAVEVYRYTLSQLKNASIEVKIEPEKLLDKDIDTVLTKVVKQRQESINSFKQGNRQDLVDHEQSQLDTLQKYVPKQMGDDEVKQAVEVAIKESGATSISDMGKIMGNLKQKFGAEFDMGKASGFVKQHFS